MRYIIQKPIPQVSGMAHRANLVNPFFGDCYGSCVDCGQMIQDILARSVFVSFKDLGYTIDCLNRILNFWISSPHLCVPNAALTEFILDCSRRSLWRAGERSERRIPSRAARRNVLARMSHTFEEIFVYVPFFRENRRMGGEFGF